MPHVRDDKPVIIVERSSGGLGGFLFGLLVGAGAALLFAPQSGEETRRVIKDRSRQLYETARRGLRDTREGAQDALDAGKAAVHSARDELERRLADSRSRGKRSGGDDDEAAE